jgi:hypothetical protein
MTDFTDGNTEVPTEPGATQDERKENAMGRDPLERQGRLFAGMCCIALLI